MCSTGIGLILVIPFFWWSTKTIYNRMGHTQITLTNRRERATCVLCILISRFKKKIIIKTNTCTKFLKISKFYITYKSWLCVWPSALYIVVMYDARKKALVNFMTTCPYPYLVVLKKQVEYNCMRLWWFDFWSIDWLCWGVTKTSC